MDPEITYIRSTSMEEPQRESRRNLMQINGNFEWLKTALFLGILFVAGFLAIRIIGPLIFSDYVPAILGLSSDDADSMAPIDVEPSDGSPREEGSATQTEPNPADDTDTNSETDMTGTDLAEDLAVEPANGAGEADDAGVVVEDDENTAGKSESSAEDGSVQATQNNFELYVVRPNDTLTSIGATFGVSIEEIIAANEFLNPHYLQLGQEINIPIN